MLAIQDYECPICLLLLFDPIKLNKCNHKFCLQCIMNLQDFNEDRFKCPICRETYNHSNFSIDQQLQGTIKKYFTHQYLQREIYFKTLVKDNRIKLKIIHGNLHTLIDTDSKNKHEWTAFVYLQNADIRNQIPNPNKLIKRVVFNLDETFSLTKVPAFKEPFELTRRGWGTFDIPVEIVFHAKYKIPNQNVVIYLDFDNNETKKSTPFFIDDIQKQLK